MAQQLYDSSRPSLLGLPASIRRRIYLYLGVARWNGLPSLFNLKGSTNQFQRVVFHGLLLSCRAIYLETLSLLYSSNIISIYYTNDYTNEADPSLQPLRNLTPSSLASLTSLKIVLNQNACHDRRKGYWEGWGKCCDNSGLHNTRTGGGYCHHKLHTTDHDRPLQSSSSSAQLMLAEFRQTANFLSSRITPRALELSLVCDFDPEDVGGAAQVVASLSLLPELKDCHVRLCRDQNPKLAQIAQEAALQACYKVAPGARPPSSASISHLLSLPRELRVRIFEYTDLVTPWKEVMWNRLQCGYQYPGSQCPGPEDMPCTPAEHGGCQFWSCEYQGCGNSNENHSCIGCFCRVRHAAYSSTCRCWAPPTPLFLICRGLLEGARFVFFSRNHFVVSDTLAARNPCVPFNIFNTLKMPNDGRYWEMAKWHRSQPPRSYPAPRVAASQFLREVVPAGCLGYLRFLELVFPPYNQDCWPHDGHPALQDWAETIDWVRDKINIPGITLRLTIAGSLSSPPKHPDERKALTPAQGDEVLAGYHRILKPLARLGGKDGLNRFHADFALPWKWTTWVSERFGDVDDSVAAREWIKSKEALLNEYAERFVLRDRYDRLFSKARGKEPEERQWTRLYEL